MRIEHVRIQNFRRFKQVDIELPDGITGLIGRNGAGKSTFLEAIGWCLYGNDAARTSKDLIKRRGADPSDDVVVHIAFHFGGHSYEVTRMLVGKTGTHTATVKANGAVAIPDGASSQREATLYISRLFHMDRDAFFTSLVARQRELSSLSEARPADRKRILLSLLRIDAVDDAIQIARVERRDARNQLTGLRAGMVDIVPLRTSLAETEASHEKQTDEVAGLENHIAALTESVEDRRTTRDRSRERQESHRRITQERTLEATRHEAAMADRARRAAERAEAQSAAVQAQGLAAELAKLPAAQSEVQSFTEQKARHGELQRLHQRILAVEGAITKAREDHAATAARLTKAEAVKTAVAGLAARREALEAQLDAARVARESQAHRRQKQDELVRARKRLDEAKRDEHEALADVETLKQSLGAASTLRRLMARLPPERTRLETVLQAAQHALTLNDAHRKETERHVAELADKTKRLHALGAESPCPTCTRPLREHHADILHGLGDEQTAAETRLAAALVEGENLATAAREAREALAEFARRETELREKLNRLALDEARHQAATAKAEEAQARAANLAAEVESLGQETYDAQAFQAALAAEDEARQRLRLFTADERELRDRHTRVVTDEQLLQRLAEQIATQTTERETLAADAKVLQANPYDATAHEAAKARLAALEGVREQHARLVTLAERTTALDKAIGELDAKLVEGLAHLDAHAKALELLAFDPAVHEALERDTTAVESRLQEARVTRERLRAELTRAQDAKARLVEQIQQQEKLAEEATSLERRVRLLERLAGDRDAGLLPEFKDHLIGRIRPLISTHAGRLFRELTNARYTDLELGDDYELLVQEDGESFGLQRFSGGESDLANLCLRLAVGQIVAERAGTESFGFLALDEVFGSQDDTRKGNILRALQGLTGRFRQILLITHIEDVKEAAEHVIRIEALDDGTSRVTLE